MVLGMLSFIFSGFFKNSGNEKKYNFGFIVLKIIPGTHFMKTDIFSDPFAIGLFPMDGIMMKPHDFVYFIQEFPVILC